MMRILAIDTTAEFGSIALVEGSHELDEMPLHEPDGFSGSLFGHIGALLDRHGLELRDIDLFAAASGPGSFTGVRIGLAAVKGLGEVLDRPVAAVSNLAALAAYGSAPLRAAVIDARRGEVFAALFGQAGDAIVPESVLKFPRFLELIGDRRVEWISAHFDPFLPALAGTRFEHDPVVRAPRALAGAIGRIAAAGAPGSALGIDANYVRRSDAELLWKA